ncbi:MAG: hypothetical protein A3E31_13975 [Candidatus Rokubacteria bacterium RIFCSPHIGHO2_12_FULL_73_22]|nr:MAG: hypothetical protein A3E31_13975 [Candidatus Rokubacteria bacterium RIFCSPHIGHO2_12_FULL_73_22]OGL22995.1 MAG: hypothetical protein A3G44_03145 [Candidatus Rokubacteria bacterium RIFCSPLOWO2_12_FULL_73_47]
MRTLTLVLAVVLAGAGLYALSTTPVEVRAQVVAAKAVDLTREPMSNHFQQQTSTFADQIGKVTQEWNKQAGGTNGRSDLVSARPHPATILDYPR